MKKVRILGAGESGTGAAVLAARQGFDTFVSDMGPIAPRYTALLEQHGIPYEQGGPHTASKILEADIIIKSPGIPPCAPLVKEAAARGIPILSEIEFAGRYTDARTVCITGSNGKTTTTMLIHHMLRSAGVDASLAGNVGKSLALQVALDPHEVYVIELSSFQLENMYDFRADTAVLLNITPDHMDRYDHSMEKYADAKFRIVRNQRPEDAFIYWADDPQTLKGLQRHAVDATPLPFAKGPCLSPLADEGALSPLAACCPEGEMLVHVPGHEPWSMPRADLALPGLHNLYNSMAAALACTRFGLTPEQCRRGLATFRAVEHRLEYVATVEGVRYINDSKATNVDSTWYALESMTAPTVLILGGTDKGNDYRQIQELVAQKVKAIVCMGADNTKLMDFWGRRDVTLADTHTLEDAVQACRRLATQGDTVLLSPCCASFDLFRNYENRGELFKAEVKKLLPDE